MSNCIKCEQKVKVNYSCYDSNEWEIYICNDCENHYWLEEIAKWIASEYSIAIDY